MPRRPRISIPGIPTHVIQRGNNRQFIFSEETDKQCFLNWLTKYSFEFDVAIHSWVLMSNHVHLLCTPDSTNSISLMMQSLGRVYVKYFNEKHKRTGTLWEGRFRSCLVQDETYLLELYRYIELNPVRAGMVSKPSDYSWSSYQCNGMGKQCDLVTPHIQYLQLGVSMHERLVNYSSLINERLSDQKLMNIRQASHKGMVLGSNEFIKKAQTLCDKALTEGKRGRPVSQKMTRVLPKIM